MPETLTYVRTLPHRLSAEDVFRLRPKIRWAALSTQEGRVAFCKMRPGLTSYTSTAEDKAFMEFGPQLITGIAEQLSTTGGAGKVRSLIVNLEKDSIFITQLGKEYLAISVDRPDDVFTQIESQVRRLTV